ncbi:hypothetical protein AAVH_17915 [Aphelenchoides avenae]|nr:hypothetical protein AAVH_17915 [Aphelenchus avenae]
MCELGHHLCEPKCVCTLTRTSRDVGVGGDVRVVSVVASSSPTPTSVAAAATRLVAMHSIGSTVYPGFRRKSLQKAFVDVEVDIFAVNVDAAFFDLKPLQMADVDVEADVYTVKVGDADMIHADDESGVKSDVFDVVVAELQKSVEEANVDVEVEIFTVQVAAADTLTTKAASKVNVFDVFVNDLQKAAQKATVDVEVDVFAVKVAAADTLTTKAASKVTFSTLLSSTSKSRFRRPIHIDDKSDVEIDVFDVVVNDLQKAVQKATVDVEVDVFAVKKADVDAKVNVFTVKVAAVDMLTTRTTSKLTFSTLLSSISRSRSEGRQTQCPRGSPFHWYVCCGKDNTECCFGVQTWCYVVFGLFIISNIITGTVALLAHFDVIFRNKKQTKKLSTGDYKSVDTNSSPA